MKDCLYLLTHINTGTNKGKGYFHSTRASAAMRMGLLRVRQQRARGALSADLLACIAFLAPPPLFLEEPVDPRVSDLPPSPPGGASVKKTPSYNVIVCL